MKASEVLQRYAAGERNFQGVNLRGQSFKGKDLSGADFSGSDIRGTNFSNAILCGTKFYRAKAGLQKRWIIFAVISAAGFYSFPSYFVFKIFKLPTVPDKIINHPIAFNIIIVISTFLFLYFLWLIIKNGLPHTLLGLFLAGSIIVLSTISVYGLSFPVAEFQLITSLILLFVAVPVAIATLIVISNFGVKTLYSLFLVFIIFKVTQSTSFDSNLFLSIWILVLGHISGTFLGWVISKNSFKHRWMHTISILLTTYFCRGTTFYNADLTDADFTEADLKNTDFSAKILIRSRFYHCHNLNLAFLDKTILSNPAVRDLLITGQGEGKSYIDANLRGANLGGANLKNANLKLADLSEATLEDATLEGANLTQVNAIGTNFTNAILTGACIEALYIRSNTILNDVECDYIYLFEKSIEKSRPGSIYSEPCPSSGKF